MERIGLILFLIIQLGFSQEKEELEYGIITSLSISNVWSPEGITSKPLYEYSGGILTNYYFNEKTSLKLKVIYERKGYADGFDGNYDTDIVFNSFTIPITFNYFFNSSRRWYVNLGPYLGYLLAAKGTARNTDITVNYNSFDIGLAGGLGYKMPINKSLSAFAEIDNQVGFSGILKHNDHPSIRNNRLALNLGILF